VLVSEPAFVTVTFAAVAPARIAWPLLPWIVPPSSFVIVPPPERSMPMRPVIDPELDVVPPASKKTPVMNPEMSPSFVSVLPVPEKPTPSDSDESTLPRLATS
jgi:hypothetical protein